MTSTKTKEATLHSSMVDFLAVPTHASSLPEASSHSRCISKQRRCNVTFSLMKMIESSLRLSRDILSPQRVALSKMYGKCSLNGGSLHPQMAFDAPPLSRPAELAAL